jgi:hypothetical protein
MLNSSSAALMQASIFLYKKKFFSQEGINRKCSGQAFSPFEKTIEAG